MGDEPAEVSATTSAKDDKAEDVINDGGSQNRPPCPAAQQPERLERRCGNPDTRRGQDDSAEQARPGIESEGEGDSNP